MDAEPTSDAALALRGSVRASVADARYRLAAALAPECRVLDAGCGLAAGTQVLQTAAPRSLIGVDRAASKLDAARPGIPAGLELRVGELAALPFGEASFDLITCFGPLTGGPDDEPILRELRRVLASGGLLLVSLPAGAAAGLEPTFPVSRVVPEARAVAAVAGEAQPPSATGPALPPVSPAENPPEILVAASDSALPELPVVIALGDELSLGALLDHADHLRAARDELAGRLRSAERALVQRDVAARALADCEARLAAVPDLEVRLLVARRQAELAEAETQRAIARVQELGDISAEREYYRAELERVSTAFDVVTTSASWRVTAPVRRIAGRARRGGAGGSD